MKKVPWRFVVPALLIALGLAFAGALPVSADAAPPRVPFGGNITDGEQTQVQMVAEDVLLEVKGGSPGNGLVEATATFAMRNQGQADESMHVRFPMEALDGNGNGYGQRPLLRDFKASVNSSPVTVATVQEPYQASGPDITWSTFDVTFPAGKDVSIQVNYVTDLEDTSRPDVYGGLVGVTYTLGTGAGWHGPIGSVVIVLRLPYTASPANVWWAASPSEATLGRPWLDLSGGAFEENEVRWSWANFEPDPQTVFDVMVIRPATWQSVLSLESRAQANPGDVQTALALAEAYRNAGSGAKGFLVSPALADLAELAVRRALTFAPQELALHSELAELLAWRLGMLYGPLLDPSQPPEKIQELHDELALILQMDPANARAKELSANLQQARQDLSATQTAGVTPTPASEVTAAACAVVSPVAATPSTAQSSVLPANLGLSGLVISGLALLVLGGVVGGVIGHHQKKA